MTKYFIQTSNGQEGPFTLQELKSKNIHSSTPIWFEGMNGWTNAGQIDSLKSILSADSPPPFNDPIPPPFGYDNGQPRGFRLSLFHWGAIGIVVIAAFLYFSNLTGDNTATAATGNQTEDVIDSTAEVVADPAEVEKNRINAEITARNTNYRNNWSRFIKAGPGAHKVSPLGGVYDLEAVVVNQTEYPLGEVIIEVSYIKDNGGIHKKEHVTIYNVPGNGKASMPAPDSDRGTSVRMEIIQISSKKMHFLYYPDIDVQGKDDPYFSRS